MLNSQRFPFIESRDVFGDIDAVLSNRTELITQCHCECNEVKRSNRKGLGLLHFVRNDSKYFCPATYLLI
ncbi:MAG: hypothetical protein RMY31_020305, partial [Dendronalium sp. ChiSLP03b]